jgi:hypothetical protein
VPLPADLSTVCLPSSLPPLSLVVLDLAVVLLVAGGGGDGSASGGGADVRNAGGVAGGWRWWWWQRELLVVLLVATMLVASGGSVGHSGRPMGPLPWLFGFLFLEILCAKSYLSSRHPCAVGPGRGSR